MSAQAHLVEDDFIYFNVAPEFTLNPSGHAPLAGVIRFSTSIRTTAEIRVSDGERDWTIPTSKAFGFDHDYIVLGLRAGRRHHVSVTVRDAEGAEFSYGEKIDFQTDDLPGDLPTFDLRHADESRMEPGFTVFGVRKSHREGAAYYGYLIALDAAGQVVWYRETGHTIGDIKRLRNCNILYLSFDNRAVELDMLGNQVNQWYAAARWPDAHADNPDAIPVDAEAFHHEIFEMENGNFVVVSIETREFDDYPASETDLSQASEPTLVVGDVIVEFKRDGTVVNRWSLFDILDPYRIGYGSLSGYWAKKGVPNSKDWSHTNGVVYNKSDDSLILSVRHQDAVIKISRATGKLIWILGTHEGWGEAWTDYLLQPEGDLDWQYHQHNANVTPDGTIILFDNGNHRARPGQSKTPAPDNYSRVVEYDIDESAMTVSQVWSYGDKGEGAYYAPFISGAIKMPQTGNVFANFGGLLSDNDGNPSQDPPNDTGWVRMVEVTYDREGAAEIVFELFIDERSKDKGWDVYRAERFESLYC